MRYAMSGRSRKIIATLCLLAAAGLFVLDYSCTCGVSHSAVGTALPQSSADIQKYDGKQFAVVRVIDGDTIDIDVPDADYDHTRIRLWGVDTPETKNPKTGPMFFGKEASEFTTKAALGKHITVYLDKDRNTRDKYNRLLAYVQLPDGTYLNEKLLREGYAYADLRFKHSFYNKYKRLESVARSQKKGLWAEITPGQMPKWRQEREPIAAGTAEN